VVAEVQLLLLEQAVQAEQAEVVQQIQAQVVLELEQQIQAVVVAVDLIVELIFMLQEQAVQA
jgi:hypothetical protein